jgi:chromatin segregation and condensation protein Rec8/ScpA/Scc1 (kleisin family)
LFHPSKLKHLNTLVENLSVSTSFFGSSELLTQLSEARNYAARRLDSPTARWTADERATLLKARDVMQEALEDREARLTSSEQSVAFELDGFDDDLVTSFHGLSSSKNPLIRTLVPNSQLVRMKVDLRELRREDVKDWDDDEELVEELITLEDRRKRLETGQDTEDPAAPLFKKRSKKDTTPLVPLPDGSTLKQIRLVRTSSAKINFIVGELQRYPDEKVRLFSLFPLLLASNVIPSLFTSSSSSLPLPTSSSLTCRKRSTSSASSTPSSPVLKQRPIVA